MTMENKKAKKVYVVGHKNPDTDSICSAIAYANLKRQLTGGNYVAKRAGQINEETQYVLTRFGVTPPGLLDNVRTQVKDIELNKIDGVASNVSLRRAWELMKENKNKSIPVFAESGELEGLITVGDIAKSYMDMYGRNLLSEAKTQYKSIAETLDGELVIGDGEGYFEKGKVGIGASNPEAMEYFIEPGDLIILGNRYEAQFCAIEMDASCIVVCQDSQVSKTIRKLAIEKGCVIISTPHDTFTVARLINQSIPVKHFMTKENLVMFRPGDYIEDIKDAMAKKRYRDFPIVDKRGRFCGFISRRRLMDAKKKEVILVDHNEKTQAVDGIDEASILEIIDHHRLGSGIETVGPVYFRNQPVGCTATIVYQMYRENGVEINKTIAALLCAAITSDTLMFRSPTCTQIDEQIARELALIAEIDIEELASNMFRAGSNLSNKTPQEICFQDFKKFEVSGIDLGVSQVNCMSKEELDEIKVRVQAYMKTALLEKGLDVMYMMLTNIIEETTELLCVGNNARGIVTTAFDLPDAIEDIVLKGVVSRKKQLIPAIVVSLQN